MLILNPVQTFVGLLIEDIKEHPKGWLKFLFVESPIGWVITGVVLLVAVTLFFAALGVASLF